MLQSLTADDLRPSLTILEDALERAVARNTLLRLEITIDGEEISDSNRTQPEQLIDDWYFMNTVKGRQTLALIRQGRLNEVLAALPDEARLKVDRPVIFVLYEQNVGILSPMIADQLKDMEKTYPPQWITEAFEIAVSRNARNLKYIQAILKRWEIDGRDTVGRDGQGMTHERHGRPARERRVPAREYDIPDDFKDIVIG